MNKLNLPFRSKIKQVFSKQVEGFLNLFQDLYKMGTYLYGHFIEVSNSVRIYFFRGFIPF